MNQTTLNFSQARAARDQGLSRVSRPNGEWLDVVMNGLEVYCQTHEFVTVEGFRAHWEALGRAHPTSVNAWGSVGMKLARSGWVEYLRHVPGASITGHSRRVAYYRSTIYRRAA